MTPDAISIAVNAAGFALILAVVWDTRSEVKALSARLSTHAEDRELHP